MGERVRGLGKRLRKNSGIASCRSSRTGTPTRRRGSGREDQEVRQRVDLDEGEPLPAVELDRRPAGADQERQVLAQVRPQGWRPGGAGRRAAGSGRRCRTLRPPALRPAQADDQDRPAGADERLRPHGGPAGPRRSSCGRSSGSAATRPARREAVTGRRPTSPAPRRRTWRGRVGLSARAIDGVHDEVGPLVGPRPVDRAMGGHDDDGVGPVEQFVERRVLAEIAGESRNDGDMRIVEADVGAATGDPGDDVGRRRVAGVADVRLEGHAEDADLRAVERRRGR